MVSETVSCCWECRLKLLALGWKMSNHTRVSLLKWAREIRVGEPLPLLVLHQAQVLFLIPNLCRVSLCWVREKQEWRPLLAGRVRQEEQLINLYSKSKYQLLKAQPHMDTELQTWRLYITSRADVPLALPLILTMARGCFWKCSFIVLATPVMTLLLPDIIMVK